MNRVRLDGTQVFDWLLILLGLVLLASILLPFWSALVFAAVLAGIFSGLQRRLSQRLGGRSALAAGLLTLLVFLAVLLPLAGLTALLGRTNPGSVPGDASHLPGGRDGRPARPCAGTASPRGGLGGGPVGRGGERNGLAPAAPVAERQGGHGDHRGAHHHLARGGGRSAAADCLLLPAPRRTAPGAVAGPGPAHGTRAVPGASSTSSSGVTGGGGLQRRDRRGPGRGGAGGVPHCPDLQRTALDPAHLLHGLHSRGGSCQRLGDHRRGPLLPGEDRLGALPRGVGRGGGGPERQRGEAAADQGRGGDARGGDLLRPAGRAGRVRTSGAGGRAAGGGLRPRPHRDARRAHRVGGLGARPVECPWSRACPVPVPPPSSWPTPRCASGCASCPPCSRTSATRWHSSSWRRRRCAPSWGPSRCRHRHALETEERALLAVARVIRALEGWITLLRSTPASERVRRARRHEERRAREAARERVRAVEPEEDEEPPPLPSAADLKSLYRRLARRFHPDLARTEEEQVRHARVMARLNTLYRAGDRAGMEALADQALGAELPEPALSLEEELLQLEARRARFESARDGLEEELRLLQGCATAELMRRVAAATEAGETSSPSCAGS